ncbi:30S ribosomal protein S12 methylthiotransferase RimO [candidate division KSB1 bacterium]|nr:30S ribosomal protein S12 methylthiotransferase RimO [candidate division KSB1 bacterium]MBL7092533.1 30S ribosomal protein S12 methylthiotransferase RimO [candidate division KSB1 bacterium]
MKISVITLGCPKNTVDSEYLSGQLFDKDVQFTEHVETADVVIINTCAFILPAREEAIETILETVALKNNGKVKRIYVTGCLPQRYQDELKAEIPEVDGFFQQKDFTEIGREINALLNKNTNAVSYNRKLETPAHYAYLKISEGCDNRCSYCTIPGIKGNFKSRPMGKLVAEANRLVDNGVRELILVAQDTTYYGWDKRDKQALKNLIGALAEINNLKWIRILYAHPAHLGDNVIQLFQEEEKLCRYIDMPIQHISDNVLRSMGRHVTGKEIQEKIDKLRSATSGIAIRTTLMVGYPGESKNDFLQLKNFVSQIQFERLGVFKFIAEENTPAAKMENQVGEDLKEDRREEIMEIQYKIAQEKSREFQGRTIPVLIDGRNEDKETFLGRSEWDSPQIDNLVYVKGDVQVGGFYQVTINQTDAYDLWAEKVAG